MQMEWFKKRCGNCHKKYGGVVMSILKEFAPCPHCGWREKPLAPEPVDFYKAAKFDLPANDHRPQVFCASLFSKAFWVGGYSHKN